MHSLNIIAKVTFSWPWRLFFTSHLLSFLSCTSLYLRFFLLSSSWCSVVIRWPKAVNLFPDFTHTYFAFGCWWLTCRVRLGLRSSIVYFCSLSCAMTMLGFHEIHTLTEITIEKQVGWSSVRLILCLQPLHVTAVVRPPWWFLSVDHDVLVYKDGTIVSSFKHCKYRIRPMISIQLQELFNLWSLQTMP